MEDFEVNSPSVSRLNDSPMENDKTYESDEESNIEPEINEEEEDLPDEIKNHPSARNEPYTWPEGYEEDPADRINIDELEEEAYEEIMHNRVENSGESFVPPSERSDVPLAAILHPQLEDIDPRQYFPDFKQNGILRFSRILATNSRHIRENKIWWGSRTFKPDGPPSNKHKNEEERENEEESSGSKKELELEFGEQPSLDDCYTQELSYHTYEIRKSKETSHSDDEEAVPWRYGPAKMWYDKMGVPTNPQRFDYGMKMKKMIASRFNAGRLKSTESRFLKWNENEGEGRKSFDMDESREIKPFPEETFLPVNLLRWEDDVIIDPEEARIQLIDEYTSTEKLPKCGWIPTQNTRTYVDFINSWKSGEFINMFKTNGEISNPVKPTLDVEKPIGPDPAHSIFPMDDYELENYRWEDDIIYDSANMLKIPVPRLLTLEYEDDPTLFGIPEDKFQDEGQSEEANTSQSKPFDRKEHQFTKKSKMILGQVQQRQKQEEEEQMEITTAQITDKDPFNLSNDDYYHPKKQAVSSISGGSLIQHSIPAQNIHRIFFPTYLNTSKLRIHHRQPLNIKKIMKEHRDRYTPVNTLTKHIRKVEEHREQQKLKEGGGDIFYMREVQDLSGKDGTLMLIEYSEEHPTLLSQPGMASKIRNYYKRKTNKDNEPQFEFGETAFTHTSPFLGNLGAGQCLQAIENNMYRAPIYQHQMGRNDFLLIRTKQGFFIRKSPYLFVAGQECPLYEVPSPNSKRATVFVRDFLLAFIYRLFWASNDSPRRLKMEDIKAAFPHYAESSVRKRLKQCSDFKRLGAGTDQNYWVLKEDFRLPSKEEVLAMVTPEMCCAQYSMLAAEQRLKDAGYGEKYFFTPENEDDSDDQVTMEDEVKCAPWNTTRAYISAMKGKCLLDQSGIADPTGCGQGFSYVRISQKPQKEDLPQMPKRLVTGTNADLRKLPLKEAKEICREYGVKEEEINALSRWEIIDVIRTLSTQAAKARSDFSGMARFARGNIRFNFADMQDKYKKHCQHIFDLQNRALENSEELSTDEGSSGEDSDNDEMATKLESMLKGPGKLKKGPLTTTEFHKRRDEMDDEERDRMDLQRMIHGEVTKTGATVSKGAKEAAAKNVHNLSADKIFDPNMSAVTGQGPRKLKIYRTVKNADGSESTRVEVITHPQLIEAYVCLRSTRDEAFIKVYAQMDEQYKEERRKEKRRLQDQLRRIRRNEARAKMQGSQQGQPAKPKPTVQKEPKPIKPSLLKMKCSACGGTGHMKTNKNCPLYGRRVAARAEAAASKITVEDLISKKNDEEDLSGELIEFEGTKLKLSSKIFKKLEQKKKQELKFSVSKSVLQVLEQTQKTQAQEGGEKKKKDKGLGPSTSKEMVERETSVENIGPKESALPKDQAPPKLIKFKHFEETIKRRRSTIIDEADYFGPVKSVHRRRADPRVSMASVLNDIFNEFRGLDGAGDLMYPVNPKKVPDYYLIIETPMDLQTIKTNITTNQYELRHKFLADILQMLNNSIKYNGMTHPITKAAQAVFELAGRRLVENEQKLMELEKAINPLLDDNDMVGFSFILDEIIQKCKNIPKSAAFHTKVDARKFPNYYEKIKRPMDLGSIEKNIKDHRYTTLAAFRKDIEQIKINSEIYNGLADATTQSAVYTQKAIEIIQLVDRLIDEKKDHLTELESNIRRTMETEVGSVTSDSFDYDRPGTSTSSVLHNVQDSQMILMDETTQMSMTNMSEVSEQQIMPDEIEDINDEENEIGDILVDDLAMSGDEDLDLDEEDDWEAEENADLMSSHMNATGQLTAELALSDSDDDYHLESAKRPRTEARLQGRKWAMTPINKEEQ